MAETFLVLSSDQPITLKDTGDFILRELTGEQIVQFNKDLVFIGEMPPETGVDFAEVADAQPADELEFQRAKRLVIDKWARLMLAHPVGAAKIRPLEDIEFTQISRRQCICNYYWRHLAALMRVAPMSASETQTPPSP